MLKLVSVTVDSRDVETVITRGLGDGSTRSVSWCCDSGIWQMLSSTLHSDQRRLWLRHSAESVFCCHSCFHLFITSDHSSVLLRTVLWIPCGILLNYYYFLKSTLYGNFTPYSHPIPLKWRVSVLACGVVCWTLSIISQISTRVFWGFGPQVTENCCLPLTEGIALTTVMH